MGRDTSSDRGGDQALWRDLVARLELPQAIDPADAPWPNRENLTSAGRADRQDPDEPVSRRRVIRPATFLRFAEMNPCGDARDSDLRNAGGQDGDGLGRGMDFQELADLEFSDEDDERYVPPEIPPLPRIDPVARGAWTALFGGPGYLFLATTLSWQVPGWAELAAIIAFIGGFVVLVSRLGDGPSRKDGPDQGAVV